MGKSADYPLITRSGAQLPPFRKKIDVKEGEAMPRYLLVSFWGGYTHKSFLSIKLELPPYLKRKGPVVGDP